MNFDQFKFLADAFFAKLQKQMSEEEISFPAHWPIDHICYRVESEQSYIEKKSDFETFAKLLIESEVNGRMICTFKLKNPIFFLGRMIDVIELPAPKPGKKYTQGFEHIEVVCDMPFSEIKNRFKNSRFDEKGLSKDFNQELALLLNGLTIKFHHLSLESVVTLEGNERVFDALKESKILFAFKEYSPLIAGTFPLGIHTDKSDLDILLSAKNLAEVLAQLKSRYGACSKYEDKVGFENRIKFGLVRFELSGVPFEIYIESTETVRQRAYLHFQLEERLLKLGGERLRDQIVELRRTGLKTEPAFAQLLGLEGDPYVTLLELHNASEERLREIL